MENNQNIGNNQVQEDEAIDFKMLLNYFTGNIHWFILSVILFLGIAYVVNRYTTKIYNIATTLLISDNTKGTPLSKNVGGSLDMFSGFGMYPSLQNFENQIIILKSYSQVRRTVEQLNFEISYFTQGRFAQQEIYKQAPFEVIFSHEHNQVLGAKFNLSIRNDGTMDISIKEENKPLFLYEKDENNGRVTKIEYSSSIKPGERIKTEYFDFYIKINENFNPNAQNNYFFFFNAPHDLTMSYINKLILEPISKGSSMLKISVSDNNPSKAIDFLNMLTGEYLLRNLEKKNEIANNTIQFIDSQLDTISKSLAIAETDLQHFKMKNKVMDFSFQSQQIFEQLMSLENQKMQNEMRTQYYQYLLTYIEENQENESILAPSAMGVNDPLLNSLIMEINRLSVEKSSLTNIKKGADFGPIQKLEAQIRNAKDNIYENASQSC
jgi:tyrosine-protein kinase Etk/Wzc